MALIFQLPGRPMTTDEKLAHIAKVHLEINDLSPKGRDSLDFYELHVDAIHNALRAAYAAGCEASDTLLRRQLGLTK